MGERSARWRFLELWVRHHYRNQGPGTGLVTLGDLSLAERSEARLRWETLWKQYQRFGERTAWLYDHPEDPQWAERSAATERSAAKFGQLRSELAEWCGVTDADVFELIEVALVGGNEEDAA